MSQSDAQDRWAARLQAQLAEYEQCVESYRHTYQTIWQIGSFFAVISAGLFALAEGRDTVGWAHVLAPVPLLMWCVGIFWPMNRYGQARKNRLVQIEESLDEWGVRFDHFRGLERAVEPRNKWVEPARRQTWQRDLLPHREPGWAWRPRPPRVGVFVGIFASALLALWLVLIALFLETTLDRPRGAPPRNVDGRVDEWVGRPLQTKLTRPLTAFRFHGHEENTSRRVGEWATPVMPPPFEDVARALLAPPPRNPMDCFTVMTIPRGHPVELGWVGPNWGYPGGGFQVHVLPPLKSVRFGGGAPAPWEHAEATAAGCAKSR